MKFITLGGAWKKKSKKGLDYISLSIDFSKLAKVDSHDFNKFCLFVNTWKHDHADRPDYTLCVPLPEAPVQEMLQTSARSDKHEADKPYYNTAGEKLPF